MTLTVDGLTVHRGTCAVLADISFSAAAGQVTALVGPNGAGKSTLLKAVLGLLPAQGRLAFAGQDLNALDAQARARLVAYVPQRSQLAAALPVRAAVAAARFAHHGWLGAAGAGDQAAVEDALAAVDAGHLATRTFSTLSAGEQQRVLVARALATGAPCILMDEPTASLDVGHALALLDLTRRLASAGRCIVIVLHHLDDARRAADRIALMHRGRILAAGAPDAVLVESNLAEAFRVAPVPGGALGFRLLERAQ
jgi:iron complex transport system ATP-binding protein